MEINQTENSEENLNRPKFRLLPNNDPRSIEEAATIFVPSTWENVFNLCLPEILHAEKTCVEYCQREGLEMYPPLRLIFRAFDLTPLHEVKVVIVGQDPYYTSYYNSSGIQVPTATGMSFSIHRDCKVPPSLKNIYKELERSIDGFRIPDHGDLTKWAEQGVLLLNMSMTVAQQKANSHTKAWTGFLDRLLVEINKVNPQCIYVISGNEAAHIKRFFSKHGINHATVLESPHPAASCYSNTKSFIGNDHFKRINEILVERGNRAIDWQL